MKLVSAIILAGGHSSRMGQNKAELDFHGCSFLQHQVDKLRAVGVEDIVISGYPKAISGTKFVPDIYPGRGPLSGIHAGLLAIKNPCALVIAVDTPLLPKELLEKLMESHSYGITIVKCGEELEPLIGIYDKALFDACEDILRGTKTSIRRLMAKAGFETLEYTGDPALLMNCNTPAEYQKIQEL